MPLSTRRDSRARGTTICTCPAEGRFYTPWGQGVVAVWQGRLVGVELPPAQPGSVLQRGLRMDESDQEVVALWVEALDAYFHGARLRCWVDGADIGLGDMAPFARRTVEALLAVPPGRTVGYGELAEMAGYPRAARAVGSVMAANTIPIVVPCHRVIRSDGSLGRYGTDPSWKKRLLDHERQSAITRGTGG